MPDPSSQALSLRFKLTLSLRVLSIVLSLVVLILSIILTVREKSPSVLIYIAVYSSSLPPLDFLSLTIRHSIFKE
jgi:hypothetical protein